MSEVQEAREASLRLVRLLGGEPEAIVPARRGFLDNARKSAEENDRAEAERLSAAEAPYWAANYHDEAYWRRVLTGKVSEDTMLELFKSMGLR